jgi:pimeloyl-ACP methyl ester carboxylesterase
MKLIAALGVAIVAVACAVPTLCRAQAMEQKVVDIPTRAGVTQRMVVLAPPQPRAAVVLFAGGHGALNIFPNGSFQWGDKNFVVRTRGLFAGQGLFTVVVDKPSDRRDLNGFRQSPEHAADIRAVIAWVRSQAAVPVWLVGTSRGTQSAAGVALHLQGPEGPDGLVLTSSILTDERSRALTEMPLGRLRIPVLVVHHEKDGCRYCAFADTARLMDKLRNAPRKELLAFNGGISEGDPCEAMAYHGYNGIEGDVVQKIATWITAKP